jgi:hypothetical protein
VKGDLYSPTSVFFPYNAIPGRATTSTSTEKPKDAVVMESPEHAIDYDNFIATLEAGGK